MEPYQRKSKEVEPQVIRRMQPPKYQKWFKLFLKQKKKAYRKDEEEKRVEP